MKLIIGLGNPGVKYERTRHNAGFRALRSLHTMHAMDFDGWKEKFGALVSEGHLGDDKAVLVMPQTFMNLSGASVVQAMQFWKPALNDTLVVYDELDIPLGAIRLRATGSAGGHNGMKSIIERLGSPDVPRIRIGIGTERAKTVPAEDFVLEKFGPDEEPLLEQSLQNAVKAIEVWATQSLDAASNLYGK